MSNLVIVAIPTADDRVWKVSSETVPHMTILSLGEHEPDPDVAHLLSYLEHAASLMLKRFYMSVDKRTELGPKQADVLLFDKPSPSEQIFQFREALLKEPKILEWFNTSDQFPEWLPHLTMGFPETPAHPDEKDYGLHGVFFDRIALWTGDYDGPTYDLKGYADTDSLMQHLDLSRSVNTMVRVEPSDALQSGTKGMKWGVRKDHVGFVGLEAGAQGGTLTKAGAKAASLKTQVKVAKGTLHVRDQLLHGADSPSRKGGQLTAIKSKYNVMDGKLSLENRDKYNSEVSAVLTTYAKSVAPKGADARVVLHESYADLFVGHKDALKDMFSTVKHADAADYDHITFKVVRDADGFITDFVEDEVEHADGLDDMSDEQLLAAEHFLAQNGLELVGLSGAVEYSVGDALQFGRKGMKWGVRHARGIDGKVTEKKLPSDSKEILDLKRKVKSGGVQSLSNEDLQKLTSRINLETSYRSSVINRKTKVDVINSRTKKSLELGRNANDALKFGASPVGQILLKKFAPGLAVTAKRIIDAEKAAEAAAKQLDKATQVGQKQKKDKKSKSEDD